MGGFTGAVARREVYDDDGVEMDDEVRKRLTGIETSLGEIKIQAAGIVAVIPHLATKAEVNATHVSMKEEMQAMHLSMKEEMRAMDSRLSGIEAVIPHLATKEDLRAMDSRLSGIEAVIPHLVTKADLQEVKARVASFEEMLDGRISASEAALVKWIVGTGLASTGIAVSIAIVVTRLIS